jgi:hypothetical protein
VRGIGYATERRMVKWGGRDEFETGAKKRLVVAARPAQEEGGAAGTAYASEYIVTGEVDGVAFEVVVVARDQMWAMSMVSAMSSDEFNKLRRAGNGG